MIETIRYLWNRFNQRENELFEVSVSKQRIFLESLPEAKDDIERSYNQYLCQMFFKSSITSLVLNLFALPILVGYYFFFRRSIEIEHSFDAVAVLDGKPANIIPLELRKTFNHWYDVTAYNDNIYLGRDEKKYFWELTKRYPLSWFFLLKALIKIGNYGYLVKAYNPKAIIVCNEYSFTSSLLTKYCELMNIEHINVMHGEKLYYIRDSFFRYHKCYVWGQAYINLFKMLRAEKNKFIVSVPQSMLFFAKGIRKKYDFIYYLGDEDNQTINKVIDVLRNMILAGHKVALRPHPRYTNIDYIRERGVEIENCELVSIEESILSTECVIAKYSTVLNQAYHNGISIVIDDVTDPKVYALLRNLHYSMLVVPHQLLSEYVKK